MSAVTLTLRALAPSEGLDRPHPAARVAACATCVAADAVAAGILLLRTSLPAPLEVLAAAAVHGAAVLFLSGLVRGRPSRRWLCVAAMLAVPCLGAAVVIATLATRGRGTGARGRQRKASRRSAPTMDAMRRLAGALSACDALDDGDEEQRRGALSALSRRGDPEAIALLRRAAAGHDPDLALSAAVVLDEIGERAEHGAERLDPAEARYAAG